MFEAYRGVVHPWLCDIMQHMTTRHYVAMFDDASYHLGHECGIKIDTENSKYGFVDVKHTVDYISELKAGDLVIIKCGINKIGNSSYISKYEMYNLDNMTLCATMEAVCVHFDLIERKSARLTNDFRAKAEKYIIKQIS